MSLKSYFKENRNGAIVAFAVLAVGSWMILAKQATHTSPINLGVYLQMLLLSACFIFVALFGFYPVFKDK